jgi:hypothetical protein
MAEMIKSPLTTQALAIARRWQKVDDTVSDDDALAQGLITPEMLQLIMQVIQQLMQNCLANNKMQAWNRVQAYLRSKPTDRLIDDTRFNWLIDRWMTRLAIPRDIGDVSSIRAAIISVAGSVSADVFGQVQTEVLFYTI